MSELGTSGVLGCVAIGIGLIFDLLGAIGLVRLPDVYNRLQAATKCVTLGTCLILLGVVFFGFGRGDPAMAVKALVCAAFVLLTSPVAGHAVARGAHISGVRLWERSVVDKYKDDLGQREQAPDDEERRETDA